MSKLIYIRTGGVEAHEPTKRDLQILSRRQFVRTAALFLPLGFFAGGLTRSAKASTIVSRTISAANQNAIAMLNATWARPVALPASWSKIRVGITGHLTNTGAGLTGTATFVMGFNSGTINQYGDASCQNFIGFAYDAATWGFTNTTTTFYSVGGGGAMPIGRTRIGTTNTDSLPLQNTGGAATWNSGAGTSSADRQAIFIDIFKGSPNYTVHLPFLTALNAVAGDVVSANYLNYMGQLNPAPSESDYNTANSVDRALAFNEGVNGTLNAINLSWNRSDVTAEICNVAVSVLA